MKDEELLVHEIGRPILWPLGVLQAILLIALTSSPIIWIWHSWSLAWKVGLTAFILAVAVAFIYGGIKKYIREELNNIGKKTDQ